jgi:hypothetical protein
MSRITAPAEADIPVGRPALDAAARNSDSCRIMHQALAASPKALNAWLDLKKAISTSLDASTGQGIAHAGTEVNA